MIVYIRSTFDVYPVYIHYTIIKKLMCNGVNYLYSFDFQWFEEEKNSTLL